MSQKSRKSGRPSSGPIPAERRRGARLWVAALLLVAVAVAFYLVRQFGGQEGAVSAPRPGASSAGAPPAVDIVESMRLPFGGPEAWREMDDPAKDGWDAEVINSEVGTQWSTLAERLHDSAPLTARDLQPLAAHDFQPASLRPSARLQTYDDGVLGVERSAAGTGDPPSQDDGPLEGEESDSTADDQSAEDQSAGGEDAARGPEALAQQLNELLAPLRGPDGVHFKAKVVRVDLEGDQAVTRQLVTLAGHPEGTQVEQHATWKARWQLAGANKDDDAGQADAKEHPPRLLSLELLDWQQSTAAREEPLTADCTASVLDGNPLFAAQFLRGMNYWFEQLQDTRYMALFGTPGLAVGDVNGDGLEDLYVCQETGLPNRLFLQQPDGTALEVSAQWHADWLDSCRSALLLDLDNDGDQDLAVATVGAVLIASNEGTHFRIRVALPCDDDTMSLCAADYDNDGRVDLYVCVNAPNEQLGTRQRKIISGMASAVYFDAMNGGRNSLFRNMTADGSWKFEDVTADVGLDAGNARVSFAASWDDFDNDGDQDLYVANDFGPNNLYRNERAEDGSIRFADVADNIAAEDRAFGMSAAWGDYNRDGNMDLYVGNMFSSAGQRVTHQPHFKSENPQVRAFIQRLARGNTLLRNNGGQDFEDVSAPADVMVGRWSWSSNFVDLNNDGWDDLLVANGYITTEDTGDL